MAHVLVTVGILAAFGAGAHEDAGSSQEMSYASENLDGWTPISAATSSVIVMDVKLDTLLEGDHYLVLDFGGARLADDLGLTYTSTRDDTEGVSGDPVGSPSDPVVPLSHPAIGNGTGFRFYTRTASVQANPNAMPNPVAAVSGTITDVQIGGGNITVERAFNGDATDSSGVYKIPLPGENDRLAIDTHIRLELGLANLEVDSAGSYGVDVYIYDNLGDARAAARGSAPNNYAFEASADLFEVASSLDTAEAEIETFLATADVAHRKGPFLGFDDDDPGNLNNMSDENVGVFASITLTPDTHEMFLDTDGTELGGSVLTGAKVVVTAAAGNFGFGVGAGRGDMGELEIKGDDPDTDAVETGDDRVVLNAGGPPTAFMVSSSPDCEDTPLTLKDADGKAVNPNAEDVADRVFSADATMGEADVTGEGPFYFCVLNIKDPHTEMERYNQVQIEATPSKPYDIAVTTMAGDVPGPDKSAKGGTIDRNGTTLNITYLSDHPGYKQRLVIVNRGDRPADYVMDDFQTEWDRATPDGLSINGTVMGDSRAIIRIQDVLTVTDTMGNAVTTKQRASGTLTLTAPERDIDVMTLQIHPGTGQIDTTIYQHGQ